MLVSSHSWHFKAFLSCSILNFRIKGNTQNHIFKQLNIHYTVQSYRKTLSLRDCHIIAMTILRWAMTPHTPVKCNTVNKLSFCNWTVWCQPKWLFMEIKLVECWSPATVGISRHSLVVLYWTVRKVFLVDTPPSPQQRKWSINISNEIGLHESDNTEHENMKTIFLTWGVQFFHIPRSVP